MSSSRRSVAVLVGAVVAACLAFAGSAGAGLIGGGVGGYVTDADTGLGLTGATLTWNGTTTASTRSDGAGHYLLAGLAAGTTGILDVAGPAGYASATVGPVALPANDLGDQNVGLHRDWAAGAPTTTDDPAPPTAGCEPGKATDNDPTTGWSASGPSALTITLPQPVAVRAVVLTPGAVCGHDAGNALGGYRVETSPDGAAWTTTGAGTLNGTAAATIATDTPGVRFVRLHALSAQAAATTIDLREVQVLGAGPNQPPSGTVAVGSPRNYVKDVVRLQAAFTDPDSTIVRYLWDFDGDGRFDQATTGPQVAHVWAGPGTYHVIVGARDFAGGLGTAALDLRIIDPTALVQPVLQRRPLITFDPVDGIDLPVRIACSSVCTFTAQLVLPKATAKAIKSPRRTILTLEKKTEGPGLGSWTIELPGKTIKLLRKAHRKSVKVRLTATAVDQQKRRTTTHRWVTFR